MARHTISSEHGPTFGMDVRARSATAKGFDRPTGEEKAKRLGDCPTAAETSDWMRSNLTAPHCAACESGCAGFRPCKELRAAGIDCGAIAASPIAGSADDGQRKTGKGDAGRLPSELVSPKKGCSLAWVPDAGCEAMRDLAGARVDAVSEVKRAERQASAPLLRRGRVWSEKTASGRSPKRTRGPDCMKWISRIELDDPVDAGVLDFCRRRIADGAGRVSRMERRAASASELPRRKPCADAPTLAEGFQGIGRRTGSKARPKRGQAVPPGAIGHCDAASRRPGERCAHLANELKAGAGKAETAIAGEAMRRAWPIGRMAQDEQAAEAAARRRRHPPSGSAAQPVGEPASKTCASRGLDARA